MRTASPVLALLLAAALAVGCAGGAGHPLRASLGPLPAGVAAEAPTGLDEPPPPDAEAVPLHLFAGLEGVLARLAALREQPVPEGPRPALLRLRDVEASVAQRYAREGFGGPVRSVIALAAVGRVPLGPDAMADLMQDPEVERQVLAASAFRPLGTVYRLPDASRERFRVELLRMGEGPFRFDLRFTVVAERRRAPDGRVWMRYDPDTDPPNEHVTLYRGGCLIEPEGAGARVTELVILGTDLRLLPPLQSQLESLAVTTLGNRATNLWVRAWGR